MKKYLLLWLLCFGCTAGLFAQKTTISGTVTDQDANPLVGAAVVVEGTSVGTITDIDGKFEIEAEQGQTLVISYIGMVTQSFPAKDGMEVALSEDVKVLDEVVAIGYGTATRAQFVGSAEAVSGEDITKQATSNVTNALQGKMAGVQVVNGSGQPGSGASIRVRGVGSISSGSTPLYVVDGVPIETSAINQINSYDIASMTVLKDASATAIYGARGANGVVLITTKGGGTDHKMTVNVDAKWGVNQKGVKNYDVMTSPELYTETAYRALYNSQAYLGLSDADAHIYANNNLLSRLGYQVFTVPAGENLVGTNFRLNPNATLGYSDGQYYYLPDNWEQETLEENQLRHEYNISVNGSSKETQYFVSAGYLQDPGIIAGSSFERFSLRTKVDSQVKKWLKVGASASYSHTKTHAGNDNSWGSTVNVFATANDMAPIYPFYVRDAETKQIKVDNLGYKVYDKGNGTTNFLRSGSAPSGNSAINLYIDTDESKIDYFSGSFYVTLTPVKGLNLTARVSPDILNYHYTGLANPFYNDLTTGGTVSKASERIQTINQQYLASYKNRFANDHNLEVLVGWETYSLKDETFSASNNQLYNPFVAELGNAYGSEPTSNHVGSSTQTFVTAGLFARVQYDLMDRYFLNGTYRYEASSRFSPEARWGHFGSVGAAWLINREGWFESENVDELKLKASWGTQGNDQLGSYYMYRDLYSISYNSETGEYAQVLGSKGNPNLTWENQMLSNVGVDFGFFKNRLSGTVEYFNRYNKDMLFNVPQPPSAGYSSFPENIGTVMNQGFELSLSGVAIETRDIKWEIFGNITYVDSKILELPEYAKEKGLSSSTYILKEGGSLSEAYMKQYAGVDHETGQALYYVDPDNGDYTTTTNYEAAKQASLGDVSAKWYGGFGTSLEVYGVDLSLSFAYQFGGKAYDGGYQGLMHTGAQIGRNWHKDILNAWTPENKDTDVPRLSSGDNYDQESSSRWLVSSNYLSLNNLTLGYTLPSKWTKKIGLQKLRVYFQGDNLALFSAREGFDPRQSQNAYGTGVGGSTSSGNYVYSQLRTLSGGISITF